MACRKNTRFTADVPPHFARNSPGSPAGSEMKSCNESEFAARRLIQRQISREIPHAPKPGPRFRSCDPAAGPMAPKDVDENVTLDPFFELVEIRPQPECAFQCAEGLFDAESIECSQIKIISKTTSCCCRIPARTRHRQKRSWSASAASDSPSVGMA